jgi:hypothetical protein
MLEGRYLEAAAVADEGNLAGLGYLLASMTAWLLCYGCRKLWRAGGTSRRWSYERFQGEMESELRVNNSAAERD